MELLMRRGLRTKGMRASTEGRVRVVFCSRIPQVVGVVGVARYRGRRSGGLKNVCGANGVILQ